MFQKLSGDVKKKKYILTILETDCLLFDSWSMCFYLTDYMNIVKVFFCVFINICLFIFYAIEKKKKEKISSKVILNDSFWFFGHQNGWLR